MIKYVKEKVGLKSRFGLIPSSLPSVACWMLYSAK